MMDFLLTGLPRSGTAWAAVWLSDGAICLHEPLATVRAEELARWKPERRWGMACTAVWMIPWFAESLRCPRVILERDLSEVNESLQNMGLPEMTKPNVDAFRRFKGPRFPYTDLFDHDSARNIWGILRPDRFFDADRWKLLSGMRIERDWPSYTIDEETIFQNFAGAQLCH